MIKNLCSKINISILSVSFFLLAFNGYAQTDFRPGYYITWDNDTVWGLIDYRGKIRNSSFCEFKENETSNSIRFAPSEIQAYRFVDDKYYVSKEIKFGDMGKPVFLEFLVDGITNLYFYCSINESFYLIEDKKGNLLKLDNEEKKEYIEGKGYVLKKNYEYIGCLKVVMSDCMEIQKDIEKVSMGQKSLIEITKEYHDYVCDGEKCIVYEKTLPLMKVRFAPVMGVNVSELCFDQKQFSNFDFGQTVIPSVGLLLNMSLPRLNEKLSIEFESNLGKSKYVGNYISEELKITNYFEAYVNLLALNSSASLKYTFPRGKVKPTLAVGFAFDFVLNKDTKVVQEEKYYNSVYTYETYDVPVSSNLYGPCLKLGCDYTFCNHTFFAALAFSYLTNSKNDVQTTVQSIYLSMGMYF